MNHVPSADSLLNRAARRRQMREQSFRLGVAGLAAGALCASSAVAAPATRLADANTYKRSETGPRVQLLQPGYNATLRGTEVPIVVSIQGRKFAPKSLELFVDGNNASNGALALDSSPTVELKWDTTLFTDGVHRLTVRVTDVQGFIGQAETQVYINNKGQSDTAAPVLSWLNINEKDVLKGVVDIQLKASDNFGVKYIFVSVNPAITPTRKPPLRQWLVNRPPYAFNFDTTKVPDGVYVLDALAWDALENEGHAPTRTFGVLNNSMNATRLEELDKFSSARRAAEPEQTAPETKPVAPLNSGGISGTGLPTRTPGGNTSPTRTTPQNAQPVRNPVNPTAAGAESNPVRIAENTTPRIIEEGTEDFLPKFPPADAMTAIESVREGATSRGAARGTTPPSERTAPRFGETLPATATRPQKSSGKTSPARVATAEARIPEANRVEPSVAQLSIATPATNVALSTVENDRTATLRESSPMRTTTPRLASSENRTSPATSGINEGSTPQTAKIAPLEFGVPATSVSSTDIATSASTRVAPMMRREETELLVTVPVSKERLARVEVETPLVAPVAFSVLDAGQNTVVTRRNAPRLAASNVMRADVKLDGFERTTNAASQKTESVSPMPVAALKTSPMHSAPVPPARVAAPTRATLPTAGTAALPQFPPMAALPQRATPNRSRDISNAITLAPMAGARKLPVSLVATSDTYLSAIATQHGISTTMLAAVNNLKPNAKIARGQKVLFPREISVRYAGKPVVGDVSSLQVGTTSVTAFRFMFEQNGGTMKWDGARRQVVARDADGKREITLTIGSKNATINEKEVAMDMAAFLLSGRTMVPVRFFEKALAARVEWEPATGRLLVSVSNTPMTG